MNGACHGVAGITTGVILAYVIEPEITLPTLAVSVLTCQLGSLIPDIDEPNSKAGKKIKLISGIIKKIFGHRGVIHTPLFLIMINLIIYYFMKGNTQYYLQIAWIAFNAGYISHLLLDLLTPYGLMLLYPFSCNKFRIIGLKGKYRDLFVATIFVVFLLVFLLFKYNVIMLNKEVLCIG